MNLYVWITEYNSLLVFILSISLTRGKYLIHHQVISGLDGSVWIIFVAQPLLSDPSHPAPALLTMKMIPVTGDFLVVHPPLPMRMPLQEVQEKASHRNLVLSLWLRPVDCQVHIFYLVLKQPPSRTTMFEFCAATVVIPNMPSFSTLLMAPNRILCCQLPSFKTGACTFGLNTSRTQSSDQTKDHTQTILLVVPASQKMIDDGQTFLKQLRKISLDVYA